MFLQQYEKDYPTFALLLEISIVLGPSNGRCGEDLLSHELVDNWSAQHIHAWTLERDSYNDSKLQNLLRICSERNW